MPVTGQDLQFVPQRGPLLSPVGPTHCAYTHTAGWRGWVRLGGWCKFQDDIYQQSRITGLLVEQLRRLTQSQTEAEPVCSGSPCKISKFTKKWLFEPLNSMKCNTHTYTRNMTQWSHTLYDPLRNSHENGRRAPFTPTVRQQCQTTTKNKATVDIRLRLRCAI